MTEDEAREAVRVRVGTASLEILTAFAAMVVAENKHQNLIAPTTVPAIWSRHVLDSVQLMDLVPASWKSWLDIGTGGGFPGMAIAAAVTRPMILVEPRRRRAEFLGEAARRLGLDYVSVVQSPVERWQMVADVISARAVASVEKLLPAARHCATMTTTWVLPRGRMPDDELDRLRRDWKGMFHVERSVTDDSSSILVATGVEPR